MSCSLYCAELAVAGKCGRGAYQVQNDFAVRVRLELGLALELLAQYSVVVDLAVDGQVKGLLLVDQRLCARVCRLSEELNCGVFGTNQFQQCSVSRGQELHFISECGYQCPDSHTGVVDSDIAAYSRG
jgi:hypothetical protein